ncbi:MAG: hypothetical protein ACFBSE_26220 [Prochloraceae cyanobacterium]
MFSIAPRLRQTFAKICLVLFLSLIIGLSIGITRSVAISDPNLSSLTARVNSLRIRVDRLESEIRNLNNLTRRNVPTNRSDLPRLSLDRDRSRAIESDDPMFQRLATLVIELKQEINDLESRLEKVEDIIY